MFSISIAPYRVVVLKRGVTIPLWNEDGTNGLSVWVYEHLSNLLGVVQDHGVLRRSRVARLATNADSSVICGIMQTGLNGFTSDLVHTETGELSHHREVYEAEFIPFFFMLACPQGEDFAILLLQRFGNLGMRDFFAPPLMEQYALENPKYRLSINRLVPADLAKKVLDDAIVKSISLVQYQEVEESSLSLGQGYEEHTKSIEIVYHASRSGYLPKIEAFFDVLRGTKTLPSIFSVQEFDYDTIKLDVEVNGRKRRIDLGRPSIMTPNVDISDDIEVESTGHPAWDSLIELFGSFAQDSLQQDGFDGELDLVMVADEEADPFDV